MIQPVIYTALRVLYGENTLSYRLLWILFHPLDKACIKDLAKPAGFTPI